MVSEPKRKRKPIVRFCGNCAWGEVKREDWMDEDGREWRDGYPVECGAPLPMSITWPEGEWIGQRTPAEDCHFWKLRRVKS